MTRLAFVRLGVAVLAAVGVGAAVARAVHPRDLLARVEPVREDVLELLNLEDPFAANRAEEVARFDSRFAAHELATRLHVVSGALFLLLAPLQFSARIRERSTKYHRGAGRLLLLSGIVAAATGLYFGVGMPYAGGGEVAAVVLFGVLFVASLARAFVAIRMGELALHREWMIRAFAVAIGVSTVRVVGAVLDLTLARAGFPSPALFVIALWTGWGISIAAGELLILTARRRF